jgi:spore coat protein U-like protein
MRAVTCALMLGAGVALAPGVARAAALNACNGDPLFGSPAVTAISLNFGAYIPSAMTALTDPFTITIACSGGIFPGALPALSIALSAGSGALTQRHMTSGTSDLLYQLYTTTSDTAVWGDGVTGGTSTVSGGGGTAASQTFTGGGYVTVKQWVKAGTYTDTILVTVSY